ncbi:MAG: TerB family tellurite resistance protein [Bacteroidetes bacterium]|nr:TerB family tellurite resistance protein [Bacteroidota bacterium]
MDISPESVSKTSGKVVLYLAGLILAGIDGDLNKEELDKLTSILQPEDWMISDAMEIYSWLPTSESIKVVANSLTEEQKKIAFKFLCKYSHVDNDFHQSEQLLLNRFAEVFGFDEATKQKLVKEKFSPEELKIFK